MTGDLWIGCEMVDSCGTLGILVNSDEHFDYVLKLTEAATAKGRQVRIHLLDKGLGLLSSDALAPISRMAKISACAAGIEAMAATVSAGLSASVELVAPHRLAELLQAFDRIVVF